MRLISVLIGFVFSLHCFALEEQHMTIERSNYKALGDPVGPYTHAVKHGNTLYLSGMTAFGTKEAALDIGSQATAIFEQVDLIARAEGSGLDNLIKVTIFVTDLSEIEKLRDALFSVYGKNTPASSLVHVAGLFSPSLKIEIEAIIAL